MRVLDLWFRMGRSIPYEQRTAYYDWISSRANQSYVVKPYPGHITMISSAGNSERQQARWGPIAGGGLTALEVPADHGLMASPPHSKLLAEYFNALAWTYTQSAEKKSQQDIKHASVLQANKSGSCSRT
jgi:hypothetical protein